MSTPSSPSSALVAGRYAIGHLVSRPDLVAEPRPPLAKRVCCRCELVLGWVVCSPEQAGKVSHGYCPACYADAALEMRAARLEEEGRA